MQMTLAISTHITKDVLDASLQTLGMFDDTGEQVPRHHQREVGLAYVLAYGRLNMLRTPFWVKLTFYVNGTDWLSVDAPALEAAYSLPRAARSLATTGTSRWVIPDSGRCIYWDRTRGDACNMAFGRCDAETPGILEVLAEAQVGVSELSAACDEFSLLARQAIAQSVPNITRHPQLSLWLQSDDPIAELRDW